MYRAVLARTPAYRESCYRVRHEVYAKERGYEPCRSDGLETDALDASANHIALRAAGKTVGTARLIVHGAVGEISRFCILSEHRCPAAVIELIGSLHYVSKQRGLTHWVALMELQLFRLLARYGVQFTPVGPLIEHRGQRQFGVTAL